MTELYRIEWRMLTTDYNGHGDYCLTFEEAQVWIETMNTKYRDMHHWMAKKV